MMRNSVFVKIVICLLLAVSMGACRTMNPFDSRRGYQQPIEPIPTEPVQIDPLPPLDPDELDGGQGQTVARADNNVRPVITTPTWRTMVGPWTVTDASGSCRLNLSSRSTLDFYAASTSGCKNADVAKISSWEYRNGEVYLYRPGGTMVARVKAGTQQMEGVLQSSGANLTLSK